MSLTDANIEYERSGNWVAELTYTPTELNSPSVNHHYLPYRHLRLSLNEGKILNDNTDTEKVTVEVVDGLEIARGTEPTDATVLDYDGDVTLTVDGAETTKTLTNGSVSFDLITDKQAGSEIEIIAESLADHPAEHDSATIEVVSA